MGKINPVANQISEVDTPPGILEIQRQHLHKDPEDDQTEGNFPGNEILLEIFGRNLQTATLQGIVTSLGIWTLG